MSGAESSRAGAFAIAAALAGLAWDPAASAADPKRVLVLLVAAAALASSRRARAPEVAPANQLFVGFVALCALSLCWGNGGGWRDLTTLGGAALLVAAASLRSREEAAAIARTAASVLGGGAALFALAEAVTGGHGLALHGGQGNPNWLGLLLAVTLPLSLSGLFEMGTLGGCKARPPGIAASLRCAARYPYPPAMVRAQQSWAAPHAFRAERGSRGERILALLALPQIPALLLAQSRTAWIALAVAAAATLGDRRAPLKRSVGVALALAGGAAAILLLTQAGTLRSFEGRIWIWRLAARAAGGALPLGDGLGAFPRLFLDLQGPALAALPPGEASRRFVYATTAHNDWLEVTAETGLPGLALLAAALASGIVACRRAGARAEAATLIAFAVSALADSPLRQPAVLIPVALALASAPRTVRISAETARRIPLIPAMGLAAAAALFPIAGAGWFGARLATTARDADPEQKIALLSRAARVDPRSGEIAFALGLAHLERGEPTAAVSALERSRPLLAQVATDVALGNAHLLAGDANAAAATYDRALRLDPGSFRARANLAVALRRLGRAAEADEQLRLARQLWPHHPALAEIAAGEPAGDE
jgi:tetratricopeptide (TPR) repeat protein